MTISEAQTLKTAAQDVQDRCGMLVQRAGRQPKAPATVEMVTDLAQIVRELAVGVERIARAELGLQ